MKEGYYMTIDQLANDSRFTLATRAIFLALAKQQQQQCQNCEGCELQEYTHVCRYEALWDVIPTQAMVYAAFNMTFTQPCWMKDEEFKTYQQARGN
jgi:hypothetical protein